MNNHKTPTNGHLESVQKLPRLYIAAAFLYYYFFYYQSWAGSPRNWKNPEAVPSVCYSFIGTKSMFSIWVSAFQQCFIKIHGYASRRSNIYSKPVSHHWEDWRRLLPQRRELQQTQKSRETQILWNPLLETNCQVWIILKHLLST